MCFGIIASFWYLFALTNGYLLHRLETAQKDFHFQEEFVFISIIVACALGVFSLSAPTQEPDTTKGPEIERIDPSVKHIEEKTLPFNSQAPRFIVSIPSEMDELGLTSLTRSASAESLVEDVNAMRILAFMTQPGETITFNLKSEQSKVRMAVYSDPKATKMKAAVRRANMPPNAARSKKLIFSNTTKEPYEMLLFVYGLHGCQYNLSWENKLKK
jgi:hypothetical protein